VSQAAIDAHFQRIIDIATAAIGEPTLAAKAGQDISRIAQQIVTMAGDLAQRIDVLGAGPKIGELEVPGGLEPGEPYVRAEVKGDDLQGEIVLDVEGKHLRAKGQALDQLTQLPDTVVGYTPVAP